MKPNIVLIILIILSGIVWMFRKKETLAEAPRNFVMLDNDKSKIDMLPTVSKDWISLVIEKYDKKEYDKYDNNHFAFSDRLCNEVYSQYRYWEKNQSHFDFMSKLNDTQKMYFAIINFEGQTNNGGVYQFLFNQPENAIITLDAFKKARLTNLARDYEIVLRQFFGKFHTIEELRNKFRNNKLNWNKRWNSFVEGYTEIPQADVIEEYFYNEEYSKIFHSQMAEFVIDNQDGLMKVESK